MMQSGPSRAARLGLRAGEWVVVRPLGEILSTLDERGTLENLPFQPEMAAFCGRRLRVGAVAHKTCDPIYKTWGRRMNDAVHLDGVRCDGSGHGGCQADCLLFWKEAWLRRADDPPVPTPAGTPPDRAGELLAGWARSADPDGAGEPAWRCQATALYSATTLLPWWDVRQYIRDVTSGNHSAWHVIKLLLAAGYRRFVHFGPGYRAKIAAYNWFQRLRGGEPYPMVGSGVPAGAPTPVETLHLQPGEWVRVRSRQEIGATLNPEGFNRGMRYDREMLRYSGGTYQVQQRVERLINERTGRMMEMKTPCIQLTDVYCRSACSDRRLGCPRALNHYWREIWLRRAEAPPEGADRR